MPYVPDHWRVHSHHKSKHRRGTTWGLVTSHTLLFISLVNSTLKAPWLLFNTIMGCVPCCITRCHYHCTENFHKAFTLIGCLITKSTGYWTCSLRSERLPDWLLNALGTRHPASQHAKLRHSDNKNRPLAYGTELGEGNNTNPYK